MTNALFAPAGDHGSAADQLRALRGLARRSPEPVNPIETTTIEALAAGATETPVAAAQVATEFTPEVIAAAPQVEIEAKPSLIDHLRGLVTAARGETAPVVTVAPEAAVDVAAVAAPAVEAAEVAAKPSLVDQLRGAVNAARGEAPVVADVAGEVVEEAHLVARPSLVDKLRDAAGALHAPAVAGAAEVVADGAPVAPKAVAAIREGMAGLGALGEAPVRAAAEGVAERTPGLASRALKALEIAAEFV